MASLAQLIADSDSENDSDFNPNDVNEDLDSGSDDDSETSGPSSKRARVASEEDANRLEAAETEEKARESAWAAFQAQLNGGTSASSGTRAALEQNGAGKAKTEESKMITIQRRYRFAGEEVLKPVEVPADSKEAKVWLAAQQATPIPHTTSSACANLPTDREPSSDPAPPISQPQLTAQTSTSIPTPAPTSDPLLPQLDALPRVDSTASITNKFSALSSPTKPSSNSNSTAQSQSNPPTKPKPIPKPKARGFGAALKASRPQKLSTLEKSRMDWNEHLNAEEKDTRDELEANRRGGGYIGKVEFLGRVSERREDVRDGLGGKRKR